MKRAFVAEWTRLARPRTWLIAIPFTILYSAVLTVVMITTAPQRSFSGGVSIDALSQSGGGTLAVTAAVAFTSVLLLAVFVGMSAGAFSRGTWRASLLHHPGRMSLATGTFVARIAISAVIIVVLFAAGLGTAYIVGPGQGVDTSSWLDAQSLRTAGEDMLRVLVFVTGWGLLGTLVGIATRSVPIGLGAAILWAGPIEHVLGENLSIGRDFFPGLLLQYVVAGDNAAVSGGALALRLAVYGVVAAGACALLVSRRDVSS
ncbi:hypothetical protein HJ588_09655 [Flexivirga sp. ID2601S]|uniref:ABC transporter permease n=1 Tax=Flexivirga aerilata TaxID=1656889 RepID=A0A849AFB2_9MICO|nr:hypothetical protein [Flexivirga aerilata]NNG39534.1 hypothetical protein [Flexivirga aerilata]